MTPVSYRAARPQILSGDLLAFHGDGGLFARLTTHVTQSPYTHTGVAVWLENGLYVVEMDWTRGILSPLSQHADRAFDVWRMAGRSAILKELALEAIRSPIHYDFGDLARIGLWKLFHFPLPSRDRGGMICSALSARILSQAECLRELPSLPTPGDLVEAFRGELILEVRT